MARVLGLDISTSVVGIAVLNDKDGDFTVDRMAHIDFKDCDDIWEKVDKFSQLVVDYFDPTTWIDNPNLDLSGKIDTVYIEEALINFTPGFSNAQTISTLVKFNAMCAHAIRGITGAVPRFIMSTHARKLCGIKIFRTSKCGKPAKLQVFEWASAGPLKDRTFEATKTGKPKPWNFDEVDAYVIARSGLVELSSERLNNAP